LSAASGDCPSHVLRVGESMSTEHLQNDEITEGHKNRHMERHEAGLPPKIGGLEIWPFLFNARLPGWFIRQPAVNAWPGT
jgi:hypothetical protein